MSKPRRLGPCPCGSGKRYKHCQGELELEGIALGSFHKGMPTVEQFRKMVKAVDESSANRLRQRALFGETGLSNSVEFGGRRMVAVGGTIFEIDPKFAPINFMGNYLTQDAMGNDWCIETFKDTGPGAHPISLWYRDLMLWMNQHHEGGGLVKGKLSGPVKAWFQLAYDVWILSHHQLLSPLIERLKDRTQFQGARYELTTYALFVRAGFELRPEDERDIEQKHVEFIAHHRESGEQVAVEAKSRHRQGVLSFTGVARHAKANQQPNITANLKKALAKTRSMPYVVCIELNLPPTEDHEVRRQHMESAAQEVQVLCADYASRGEKFPATLVILTNYPHHYGGVNELDPVCDQSIMVIAEPAHPFASPTTLLEIRAGLESYGNLPRSWEDFDR